MDTLLLLGLLLNGILILVNRFFWKMPDWLHIALLILGIILMILGLIRSR